MAEETETTAGAEAPVDATVTTEEAVTETAKEETAAEGKEPEAAEDEQTERPRRESGYARMKRRALLAEAQLANARLKEATGPKAGEGAGGKDDKAPREEDFNGDWGKYIAATAAYEAKQAVKSVLDDDRKASQTDRAKQLENEVLADFEERTEEFRTKAPDFDDVVSGFVSGGGKFSDAVRDLVMDSDVGPQLTYHLAKNPTLANKLNGLTPLQAAKEVGRLEDVLSKPSTKATKTPAPLTKVTGGASAGFDPATASMEEYVAKRNAGWRG